MENDENVTELAPAPVDTSESDARRRRLIKFAAIAGGALVGLVVLAKLSSGEDADEETDEDTDES